MKKAKRLDVRGSSLILAVVLLTVLAAVALVGINIASHNNTSKESVKIFQPKDYSDCAYYGGKISGVTVPETDFYTPLAFDSKADTLTCNYQKNNYFHADNDARCHDEQACNAISVAVKSICTTEFGAAGNTMDPTFKYLPVIKNNYAKLSLTDCSPNHYKVAIGSTVVMKKSENSWAILKNITEGSSCQNVDNLGIPPELDITCKNLIRKSRIIKN